jgi:basic amino acid/polyamine antiporter, APA family
MTEPNLQTHSRSTGFLRELGLLDSTMIVAGSMIGSGIFIVSADVARLVGSSGWLLAAWVVTGIFSVAAALCYGELSAMMPKAGGQYVYLCESYSPLWGFLYGWTLFLIIQTGTIAAVSVAFARFLGVLWPWVSPELWVVPPIHISSGYAISLSTQQLMAIVVIALLTVVSTRGIRLGKLIQNVFTLSKTLALVLLILLGIFIGCNSEAIAVNFQALWTPRGVVNVDPGISLVPTLSATSGIAGLFIAFCVAQVGTLFSADAWNNITFAAGEVKTPTRSLPKSLITGTVLVVLLYVLANVAYLMVLPITGIQNAPDDRVATAVLQVIFGSAGAAIMAVAIMISTFGCNNGMILSGARVYYAMSQDGLFFRSTGRLNSHHVPAVGLILQGIWSAVLVLPRTRLRDAAGSPLTDPATGAERYGNLYSNLLDYVVFAVLIFYVLTVIGLFILRRKKPDAERPYRVPGYPVLPILYILFASVIMVVLVLYRSQITWPGLCIVGSGIPIYFLWKNFGSRSKENPTAEGTAES